MLELIKNHIAAGTLRGSGRDDQRLPTVTYGVEDTALREFDTARENKKFSDAVRLVEKYHQTYNGRITLHDGTAG